MTVVNTEMLRHIHRLMEQHLLREEELLLQCKEVLLQCEMGKNYAGYDQLWIDVRKWEKTLEIERKWQRTLETIVMRYEQTERKLLRLQEEGIRAEKPVTIGAVSDGQVKAFLERIVNSTK